MANQESRDKILHGWKEIAVHLKRGLRTVQRWELELGLPIRRPRGTSRSPVIALPAELDAWLASAPFRKTAARSTDHSHPPARIPLAAPVKVLVVEDSLGDVNTCISLLRRMGAAQVDVASNIPSALHLLSRMVEGAAPKPDLILLDLAFSTDSGFDVLRYLKEHPELHGVRVIVWTEMDMKQSAFCNAFRVERVVPKWAGVRELELALRMSPGRSALLN